MIANQFGQLYIICSDLFILMTESGDASDTVEPFTVIRLGKALGGKTNPGSLFGSQGSKSDRYLPTRYRH